jgi:hypothetical protein
MGLAYVDQHDVEKRLNSSICRFDGKAVYVQVKRGDPVNTVWLTHLGTGENPFVTKTTDPLFVHKSPALGYVNVASTCLYVGRMPDRKQTQGLNWMNTTIIPDQVAPNHLGIRDIFNTKAFAAMIEDKYPPFELALHQLQQIDNYKGVAFHKHIAIKRINARDIGLFYRARFVAMWDQRRAQFFLLPNLRDGSFLSVVLRRHGVPI